MRNIKYSNAAANKTVALIYVSRVKMNEDNSAISKLYYYEKDDNNKWSDEKTIDVSNLSKKIFNDEIIAWAGRLDNTNHQFANVCKIIPMIKDGYLYVTSVSDEDESNNLENLPGYVKK